MPTIDDKMKRLKDARTRFSSRMDGVRAKLAKLTDAIRQRRKKNLLKSAWTRFKSKIADIRKRTFALMINMDKKHSEAKIEDVRRDLLDI